jgi:hypothetical protein
MPAALIVHRSGLDQRAFLWRISGFPAAKPPFLNPLQRIYL